MDSDIQANIIKCLNAPKSYNKTVIDETVIGRIHADI